MFPRQKGDKEKLGGGRETVSKQMWLTPAKSVLTLTLMAFEIPLSSFPSPLPGNELKSELNGFIN